MCKQSRYDNLVTHVNGGMNVLSHCPSVWNGMLVIAFLGFNGTALIGTL